MAKSWTNEWERLTLPELRDVQAGLARALRRKALEAAPPRGWDVSLFGDRRYRSTLAQVAPARLRETLTQEHRRCVLGISLGSQNSEGARFAANLTWVSENFDHCALVVGDSMYRYTLEATRGVPADEARPLALQAGRAFVDTHRELVANQPGQCTFEWLPHSQVEQAPEFEGYLAHLRELHATDAAFAELVDGFGELYLGRAVKADEDDEETWRAKQAVAVSYLLEETAGFCCLVDRDLPVLVYPGAIKTFVSIAEGEVPGVPEPLQQLVCVALRLNRAGLYFVDEGPEQEEPSGFLEGLSDDGLRQFFGYTEELSFRAGERVLERGRADRALYVVGEGEVEVLVPDGAGGRQRARRAGTGSVFGEQAFLDGQPRSADVDALTDCRVLRLTLERFEQLRAEAPEIAGEVAFDVGRVLSSRLRQRTGRQQG